MILHRILPRSSVPVPVRGVLLPASHFTTCPRGVLEPHAARLGPPRQAGAIAAVAGAAAGPALRRVAQLAVLSGQLPPRRAAAAAAGPPRRAAVPSEVRVEHADAGGRLPRVGGAQRE